MKTLYESLLDDEENLIDDDSLLLPSIFQKIFDRPFKSRPDDEKILQITKNGICLDIRIGSFLGEIYKNTISGEKLNDIYYIQELYLFSNYDTHITKQPLHIHHIQTLRIDNDYLQYYPHNLKIDKVDQCRLILRDDKQTNWSHNIKNINSDHFIISGSYDNFNSKSDQPIDSIKNINTKILELECFLFKDKKWATNHQKFILTEDNAKLLEKIFADNKFEKLIISNSNSVIRAYEIKKSPRSEFGFKLINIRRQSLLD